MKITLTQIAIMRTPLNVKTTKTSLGCPGCFKPGLSRMDKIMVRCDHCGRVFKQS